MTEHNNGFVLLNRGGEKFHSDLNDGDGLTDCWEIDKDKIDPGALLGSSFFIFCRAGSIKIYGSGREMILCKGQYATVAYEAVAEPLVDGSHGYMVRQRDHTSMRLLGGPVEKTGRLAYIDGCTDSLLLPPVKKGDPCLNALFFPSAIDQTMHTHPSVRVGMVISGRGVCETPEQRLDMTPGLLFKIPRDGLHRFQTSEGGMVVIAYHPDSDVGPTDEEHQMITRTLVDGVSAADPAMASIRTDIESIKRRTESTLI